MAANEPRRVSGGTGTDGHLDELRTDPAVAAFIRPEGYLVTRFIDGGPVGDEAVHRPETIRAVAEALRRVHGGPAIPGLFVPLRIVEAYAALAAERGVRIPPAYERARAAGRRIESALLAAPLDPVPCHNDLLNANFIDDGRRIRIVEYFHPSGSASREASVPSFFSVRVGSISCE